MLSCFVFCWAVFHYISLYCFILIFLGCPWRSYLCDYNLTHTLHRSSPLDWEALALLILIMPLMPFDQRVWMQMHYGRNKSHQSFLLIDGEKLLSCEVHRWGLNCLCMCSTCILFAKLKWFPQDFKHLCCNQSFHVALEPVSCNIFIFMLY